MLGCGSSSTTFTGVGGNGGTSPTGGSAGSEQGGSAGTTAGTDSGGTGGTAGDGGTGGTGNGGASNGGSSNGGSGGSSPQIDYEPVGIGDPWFFSSASELDAFEVELTGATGEATWNEAGEMRLPLTFSAAADKAFIHFTAPFDSTTSTHDPIDLTHRVLKARVRLASGATATGGVEPYSQSTSGWTWDSGDWNSFSDLGTWHEVEYDFDTAAAPGSVLRFGLQVYANSGGSAEIIIDDIRLEPKPEEPQPDGGVEPQPDAGGVEPIEGDAGAPDAGGGGGLGYEPIGIGDPWFFTSESEMADFTFGPAYNSTASVTNSWSSGEVHMNVTCAQNNAVQMLINMPYNGTINTADLSGRVLKTRIKAAAGATATGGVQMFAQSGGWQWANSDWNDSSGLSSFVDVAFPLSGLADASNVQQIGVQFYCTSADGTTIELIVDDFRIEPAN